MTKAVLICPGRGTYGAQELGVLSRQHADKADMIAAFDGIRRRNGEVAISALDAAKDYVPDIYTRGDIASPLIYAVSLADAVSIDPAIKIVAVTGNSMGWYSALAVAGAVSPADGFEIVNKMGGLMQRHLIGGQVLYPFVGPDWRPAPNRKEEILKIVAAINDLEGHFLSLSIDLGGMLVLAGDEAGLSAFCDKVPQIDDRYPLRLLNHAGFHSALQAPVASAGQAALPPSLFHQPALPLIDGRGHIWWPGAVDCAALWRYTFSDQVVSPYDFTRALGVAAREFAPDCFIITGPGTTLGGAVAQALIAIGWQGLRNKTDFKSRQNLQEAQGGNRDMRQENEIPKLPLVLSMGMTAQRAFTLGNDR